MFLTWIIWTTRVRFCNTIGQCLNLTPSNRTAQFVFIVKDADAYDYDSSGRGGNRFATILLYMSDLGDEDGGETVFSKAPPAGSTELRSSKDVIDELRSSTNLLDALTPGSWEEDMAAKCRSRLSVKPHKSRAVLFYSQLPNGEEDPMSFHGGCPVLGGTKW